MMRYLELAEILSDLIFFYFNMPVVDNDVTYFLSAEIR